MKKIPTLRLLPAVIAVALVLFGLKAAGIAFTAGAQEAAAKSDPKAAAAMPDPTAAIKSALPNPNAKPQAPADAPADPNAVPGLPPDLAGTGLSASEVDVLSSLAGRRDALDDRARELDTREKLLAATESRIDGKIADLKGIQDTIEQLLGQRDQKETEQLDSIVKIYTAMKPKDAARIFGSLDDNVRVAVAGRMKPDVLAGVLSGMPDAAAQKLTLQLANRYKLPEPTAAAAAQAVAAPPPAVPSPPADNTATQSSAAAPAANAATASAPPTPAPAAPAKPQTQASAAPAATAPTANAAPAAAPTPAVTTKALPQTQASAAPAAPSPAQTAPAAQPKSGG